MTTSSTVATAVDANVLFDVLLADRVHGDESRKRLNAALAAGSLLVSDIVVAEIATAFDTSDALEAFMARTWLERSSLSSDELYDAGIAWRGYTRRRPRGLQCARCGAVQQVQCDACGERIASRQHIAADFLIGAHARQRTGRLLTRDHGFYETYFPDLDLV